MQTMIVSFCLAQLEIADNKAEIADDSVTVKLVCHVFSPQLCVGFLFLILYPEPPPSPPPPPPPPSPPPLCHTPTLNTTTFTHHFVNHHLSHTSVSTTIFHTHLCQLAGVALGDIHLRFTWQAWHLETSTLVLRGRRGTYGTGLALVALVAATTLSHTIFHTELSPTPFLYLSLVSPGACLALSTLKIAFVNGARTR